MDDAGRVEEPRPPGAAGVDDDGAPNGFAFACALFCAFLSPNIARGRRRDDDDQNKNE